MSLENTETYKLPKLPINASGTKTRMPNQDPIERSKNFEEVALGLENATCKDTEPEVNMPTLQVIKDQLETLAPQIKDQFYAIQEASRCFGCSAAPCVTACPVGVPIPAFLGAVQRGNIKGALKTIKTQNLFPAICGRVCPQEKQCESLCVRGKHEEPVAIGYLERFVADYSRKYGLEDKPRVKPPTGKKVAIVGSGPGGLACAGELAKAGHSVTIFEALHKAGGVLVYGIPEFRLPKDIVADEISKLKDLGVTINKNVVIGRSLTIDELMESEGFDAVYIGSGAGLPKFMKIPGENLSGVFSANEYLTRSNLMKAYEKDSRTPILKAKNAIIVGGGNVAMDAARTARRLGANTTIVYRRAEAELPARLEEIEHAKEEGINFQLLHNPVELIGNDNDEVTHAKLEVMELGEPDDSGRRRPISTGEFVTVEADCVIIAIGNSPNPLITSTTKGLEAESWGGIITNEKGATSKKGVWAGGDAVTGAATVILALGAGKTAACDINEFLL